jgi:hypothetical protein
VLSQERVLIRSSGGLATGKAWPGGAERGITKHLKNSVQNRLNHADRCLKGEPVIQDLSPT